MNTSIDKKVVLMDLITAIPKNISKYILVLLIKVLMAIVTIFILLGLIIMTSHLTHSLHGILSLVLLFLVPIISTILLWALLLRIPFFQLPRTKEVLYVSDEKIFFCSQIRSRYNTRDNYYYIDSISEVKKHLFVWTITGNIQKETYTGHITDSRYQKQQKEVLISLVDKPTELTTIRIGRLYDHHQEHCIDDLLQTYQK
jgi:hypothetical protein